MQLARSLPLSTLVCLLIAQPALSQTLPASAAPAAPPAPATPAVPPARPTPPTRPADGPGAPAFTRVPGPGASAPINKDGDFLIGPDYVPAPELNVVEGVPQGKVLQQKAGPGKKGARAARPAPDALDALIQRNAVSPHDEDQ